MYFLQRLFLLGLVGLSLLVLAFGLFRFAVEVGVSPGRYVVQDLGVAAAGLMGLFLCWRHGRKLRARREAALAPGRQFKGYSLDANARPLMQVLAVAFFGLLAVACGWFLLQGERDLRLMIAAGICAVLFLLMIPLVRSQYRPGLPTLRLDGRGLDHVWFGAVPWTAVHGISHRQVQFKQTTIHTLMLGVSEPARYLGRLPWIARLMSGKLSIPRGRYGVLEIGLNPLDQDPHLIVNAATTLRERVSPASLVGWHPGMDDEAIEVGLALRYLADNPDRLPPDEILARMQAIEPRMKALTARLTGRR